VARRVLFVGHGAERTGPPMFLLGLQRWLRANTDLELATALQQGGELLDELAELGEVHLLGGDEVAEPVLDASGFDLVYLNASWAVRSLPALDRPRAVVAHVHEMDDVIRLQLPDADRARLLHETDLLLVGARSAARNLRAHGVAAERIVHVPYFLPAERPAGQEPPTPAEARATLGFDPDRPLVLGGGVFDWRKAPDLLLHVAWHLRRRDVDVQVAWVGDRNERPTWCTWDEEAARLGLADRARHLPATPDLAAVLGAADVFVLSSREDTFPLVCLEAASLGVPVVCFDDAGIVELLEDAGDGWAGAAVAYPDLAAMADEVQALLDPEVRAAVGARAQARYEQRHRIDVVAPRLLAALEPWIGEG
jgi:glycosyltransferase involved in cell wall biosynthesis